MEARAAVLDSRLVVLVRLMVGIVFFTEGIQKFLYPADLGAGRFAKIGIPWPDVMGPAVGVAEIICGALVLAGLLTRPAAAILLVDISVALVTTKLPILLGHPLGPFTLAKLPRYGFLAAMHEARTDLCMWLGCVFLIRAGAGAFSAQRRDRSATSSG
jgi:putative oxidoreductase